MMSFSSDWNKIRIFCCFLPKLKLICWDKQNVFKGYDSQFGLNEKYTKVSISGCTKYLYKGPKRSYNETQYLLLDQPQRDPIVSSQSSKH